MVTRPAAECVGHVGRVEQPGGATGSVRSSRTSGTPRGMAITVVVLVVVLMLLLMLLLVLLLVAQVDVGCVVGEGTLWRRGGSKVVHGSSRTLAVGTAGGRHVEGRARVHHAPLVVLVLVLLTHHHPVGVIRPRGTRRRRRRWDWRQRRHPSLHLHGLLVLLLVVLVLVPAHGLRHERVLVVGRGRARNEARRRRRAQALPTVAMGLGHPAGEPVGRDAAVAQAVARRMEEDVTGRGGLLVLVLVMMVMMPVPVPPVVLLVAVPRRALDAPGYGLVRQRPLSRPLGVGGRRIVGLLRVL